MNIMCGNDAIAIPTNIEWDDDCDFAFFFERNRRTNKIENPR